MSKGSLRRRTLVPLEQADANWDAFLKNARERREDKLANRKELNNGKTNEVQQGDTEPN